MTEYKVVPNGTHWTVKTPSGHVVSNHRKKDPAVNAAIGQAGAGDTVTIHRRDGTIQDVRSY